MEKTRSVDQKRKRSLVFNRIFGILVSTAIFALLFCFYFKKIDEWIFSISTIILSAINFITSATISEIEGKDSINTVNLFFSIVFFLFGIGIMVYGFITKNLVIPFIK